jgi:hypothetical protein
MFRRKREKYVQLLECKRTQAIELKLYILGLSMAFDFFIVINTLAFELCKTNNPYLFVR